MADSNQNSFLERARALEAKENAELKRRQEVASAAEQRSQLVASDGPATAQRFATESISQVQAQVTQAGGLFVLPADSQRGATLEIVVRDKWLVTGNLSGSKFVIAIYDLTQHQRPKGLSGGALMRVSYRIDLDAQGKWCWQNDGGTSVANLSRQTLDAYKDPAILQNTQMVDHILGKAIQLAERGFDAPRGGFIVS